MMPSSRGLWGRSGRVRGREQGGGAPLRRGGLERARPRGHRRPRLARLFQPRGLRGTPARRGGGQRELDALRLPRPPLRCRGRGRRRRDGGASGHDGRHARGGTDGHRPHREARLSPAVALVPRGGRQAGGALGGEGRPQYAAAAGGPALLGSSYSLNIVEEEFRELLLEGVLGSSSVRYYATL